MVHMYRLFILLSTAAARKASWERTLPGSRDSSTKGAALRRKAKFDVLRKKALKNGHEELAAAIDELKRRDAALTEAERANRAAQVRAPERLSRSLAATATSMSIPGHMNPRMTQPLRSPR